MKPTLIIDFLRVQYNLIHQIIGHADVVFLNIKDWSVPNDQNIFNRPWLNIPCDQFYPRGQTYEALFIYLKYY